MSFAFLHKENTDQSLLWIRGSEYAHPETQNVSFHQALQSASLRSHHFS